MGRNAWVRIIPFAVFMSFIGVEQGLQWLLDHDLIALTKDQLLYIYPLKAALVAILLFCFRKHYTELTWSNVKQGRYTLTAILIGLLVFVLWINMDWDFAAFGENQGYDPFLQQNAAMRTFLIGSRLFGAALVVPVMEELFWRSFLLRCIINPDFSRVAVGTYTPASFFIGALLFGLEHHLVAAGIMAGMVYSLLLYRTKSLWHCILAHAVTNLALGLYVLGTGSWTFW